MSTEVALAVSSDGERIEDRRSGRVAQVVNPMLTSLRYLQWDSKSPRRRWRARYASPVVEDDVVRRFNWF